MTVGKTPPVREALPEILILPETGPPQNRDPPGFRFARPALATYHQRRIEDPPVQIRIGVPQRLGSEQAWIQRLRGRLRAVGDWCPEERRTPELDVALGAVLSRSEVGHALLVAAGPPTACTVSRHVTTTPRASAPQPTCPTRSATPLWRSPATHWRPDSHIHGSPPSSTERWLTARVRPIPYP
jgi:hypothetical protein